MIFSNGRETGSPSMMFLGSAHQKEHVILFAVMFP